MTTNSCTALLSGHRFSFQDLVQAVSDAYPESPQRGIEVCLEMGDADNYCTPPPLRFRGMMLN